MRKRINNIIGQIFGELTVGSYSHKDSASRNYFTCICSCGKSKTIQQSNLLSGRSLSCGCSRRVIHISDVKNVVSLSHMPYRDEPASAELDISTLPIITRSAKKRDPVSDDFISTNPMVLKETIFLSKGDRVVIKKSNLIGTSNRSVTLSGFDVTLDDGSIVMVESINDVWLLNRYNDKQRLGL